MRSIPLKTALFSFAVTAILSISCLGQAVPGRPAKMPTSSPIPAAKPCTLNQATLPKIGEVQMGSKYEEVLELHPEMAEDKFFQKRLEEDNSGRTVVKVWSVFEEPRRNRPAEVSLFFADRILSVIYIDDRDLEDFKSINEAIAWYSRYLGVGTDQWSIDHGYAGVLRCNGFSVYVNSYNEEYPGADSISIHADVEPKIKKP